MTFYTDIRISNHSRGNDEKRGLMFWLFVAMVFLYPVWPVFIERKLGPLPSLTPQKLLNYALLGLFLLQMAFSATFAKNVRNCIAKNADIAKVIAWLFFFKLLSCFFSIGPFYSIGLLYYETLTTICVLFIALSVLKNYDDLEPVFTAMLLSAVVIIVYTAAEVVAGKNLLEPFIPKETGSLALINKIREGTRRVQGTFASPLLLAEYAAMMLPVILLAPVRRSGFWINLFMLIFVIGDLVVIYYSRTRTALGVVGVTTLALASFWLIGFLRDPRKNPILKYMIALYGSMAIFTSIGIAVWVFYTMAQGYSIDKVLGIGDSATSLYTTQGDARWVQLQMAIPKILESPLWGYGIGIGGYKVGFVGTDGMLTLDSHLLVTVVDSGIPAVLLTVFLMGLCTFKAYKLSQERTGIEAQWAVMIMLSLGCVGFFMILSPLVDLFPIAYVLIASLMVLRANPPAGIKVESSQ